MDLNNSALVVKEDHRWGPREAAFDPRQTDLLLIVSAPPAKHPIVCRLLSSLGTSKARNLPLAITAFSALRAFGCIVRLQFEIFARRSGVSLDETPLRLGVD